MLIRLVLLLAACALPACLVPVRALAGACEEPARAAEQAFGLPTGLLAAIGRIETGRRDASGRAAAWPWSVNAAGQGYFLPSAAEAVSLVASLQARGVQSIDVGCFQVNLFYHPDLFASLADAFDPAVNAMAAGRFLRDLRATASGWEQAVAWYHSADPGRGEPYMRRVMADWVGGPMLAPAISRVAALVQVIVPGGPAYSGPRLAGLRLPLVITPSHSPL